MRLPALIIAAAEILLSSCHRVPKEVEAARSAEQRYAMVSNHGTVGEKCAAAIEVRDAWLKAQVEDHYKEAELRLKTDCDITLEAAGLPANARAQSEALNQMAEQAADDALNVAKADLNAANAVLPKRRH